MKRAIILSILAASSQALAHGGHSLHFHPHAQGTEISILPWAIAAGVSLASVLYTVLTARK